MQDLLAASALLWFSMVIINRSGPCPIRLPNSVFCRRRECVHRSLALYKAFKGGGCKGTRMIINCNHLALVI